MNKSAGPESQGSSTRPYLIRALHDWCTDNGFTPYLAVFVDRAVQVPMEYVKNNEIVLNVSFEATSSLQLGNEQISFKARFGGVAREIIVPIDHVIAIYARETGQVMAFPVPTDASSASRTEDVVATEGSDPAAPEAVGPRGLRLAAPPQEPAAQGDEAGQPQPPEPPGGGRPSLKRVK